MGLGVQDLGTEDLKAQASGLRDWDLRPSNLVRFRGHLDVAESFNFNSSLSGANQEIQRLGTLNPKP